MDPTSKIRTSFEPALDSSPTLPEEESSQTQNPLKDYRSSADVHVQDQNEGSSTKNIKDKNISNHIFTSSDIPTDFTKSVKLIQHSQRQRIGLLKPVAKLLPLA